MLMKCYLAVMITIAIFDIFYKLKRNYLLKYLCLDLFSYIGLSMTTYLYLKGYVPSQLESALVLLFIILSLAATWVTFKAEVSLVPDDQDLSDSENLVVKQFGLVFGFALVGPLYFFAIGLSLNGS